MSVVGKICRCGDIVQADAEHSCLELQQAAALDSQRRHRKQREHGRGTAWWQRLRELALERDHHRCQLRVDAGCTGTATTVHVRPELEGDHTAATLDDVTSACAHCHGVVDGPRAAAAAAPAQAKGGRGQRRFERSRPAPGFPRVLATPSVTNQGNA